MSPLPDVRADRPQDRASLSVARPKPSSGDHSLDDQRLFSNIVGGVISPLLANVYLHYVLDEWFVQAVQPVCEAGRI